MVNEGICGKRQDHLGGGEFIEDTGDECELHLGKPGLIEKENRTARTRLSLSYGDKDIINFILEKTIYDSDSTVSSIMATFSESFS